MNSHHTHNHNNHAHDHNIAKKWKTLSGQNNWEGLLDPLDLDLRKYIIHYGEMAQSTYDTFNHNKISPNAGNTRFSKTNFFSKVCLSTRNPYKYRVTKFLYATSGIDVPNSFILKSLSREAWSKESNFIGFVAVAEDETVSLLGRRDIVVAWRGTAKGIDWVNDLLFFQVSGSAIFGRDDKGGDPKIHEGWYSIYTSDDPKSRFNKTSARNQVIHEIQRLVEKYKNEEISITTTGHSLGATLATLTALDITINKINTPKQSPNKTTLVTCIIFACPKIGDTSFKNIVTQNNTNLKILRIRNVLDVVPNYPLIGYTELGTQLIIDTTKSPYLKTPGMFLNWHSMEAHLHCVAGWKGSGAVFELVVKRDIALANKSLDNLKDEYLVPVSWWVWKNMGMVELGDGSWVFKDYETEDEYEDEDLVDF